MASSKIITSDSIAEDGAIRDGIGAEFRQLGEVDIPSAEEALARFAQALLKTSQGMGAPVDLKGVEDYEKHMQLVMKTDVQYEKVQQAKLNTQKLVEAANKRAAKDADDKAKSQAKEEAAILKASSAYAQLNEKYKESAKLAKDLAAAIVLKGKATEQEAEASRVASNQANALNNQLKGIDATLGNAQRNVGNYNNSLTTLSKGLRGLGGLGRILSDAIGIPPEAAMAVSEAGRALRDIHHIKEVDIGTNAEHAVAEAGDTTATEYNTLATEANIAAKEEESAMSNIALGLWGLLAGAVIAGGIAIWEYISAKKEQEKTDKENIADIQTILTVQEKVNGIIDQQKRLIIDLAIAKKQMSEQDGKIAKDELDRNKEIVSSLHENVKARQELMKTHGLTEDMLDENGNAKTTKEVSIPSTLSLQERQEQGFKPGQQTMTAPSDNVKEAEAYNKAVEKLNNTSQAQIDLIKKNFQIKAAISKAEEKLNDDDYQNMQAHIKRLKNETEDKKTQLDLQLQYDLNANSERNASLQSKNDEGKIIWENYYKSVAALTFAHLDAMRKIADETDNAMLSEKAKKATDDAKEAVRALTANTDQKKEGGLYQDALKATNAKYNASDDELKAKAKQQEIEANNTIADTEELNAKILQLQKGLDNDLADSDRKRYDDLFALEDKEMERKKKMHDDEMKMIKEKAEAVIDFAASSLARQNEYTKTTLDNDLQMRQDNILQQQQLASEGLKNTLAFQQAAAAKDELAKQQLAIKQLKDAKAIALFKLLASAADSSDALGALAKAFAAMGVAGAVSGSYEEGIEDTGGRGTGIDNKGGKLAIIHERERIMTAKQNAMVGGMSNDELASLAYKYQMGGFDLKYVNSGNNADMVQELQENTKQIKALQEILLSRPVSTTKISPDGIVSKEQLTNGLTKVIHYKPSNNNYI